jgi:hypothetical protein
MAKSMDMQCMYRFYKAVVAVFGPTYLRTSNAARGFSGIERSKEISWDVR